MKSELFIFALFHAKEGLQEAVAATIHEIIGPTLKEPGCLSIYAYCATKDPRLFYVHSHCTVKRHMATTPSCRTTFVSWKRFKP
jgi:quinol monooxygenase YgiN